LTFPGTRWYVMTVRDTQMVRDQKKFENHCFRGSAVHNSMSRRFPDLDQNRRTLFTELFQRLTDANCGSSRKTIDWYMHAQYVWGTFAILLDDKWWPFIETKHFYHSIPRHLLIKTRVFRFEIFLLFCDNKKRVLGTLSSVCCCLLVTWRRWSFLVAFR